MHGNGVKTDPHGNLFEGEEGGQASDQGGDKGGNAKDWLNEAVERDRWRSAR